MLIGDEVATYDVAPEVSPVPAREPAPEPPEPQREPVPAGRDRPPRRVAVEA
jgi:hypothetical protein